MSKPDGARKAKTEAVVPPRIARSSTPKEEQENIAAASVKVGYVSCPLEKRLSLLFTFLKRNRDKKVVVLFNSTASARYHSEILDRLDLEAAYVDIDEKQSKINALLKRIEGAESGFALLCHYDFVARRKDVPVFDWYVLYEPVGDFLLQVGRNRLLVVLQPHEVNFLDYLKESFAVHAERFQFAWSKIVDVQLQVEKLVSESYALNGAAKEAFKGFLRRYNELEPNGIFNVKNIELKKLCLSFGFKVPVAVDLTDAEKGVSERRKKRSGGDGYGYYGDAGRGAVRSEYQQREDTKRIKVYKPLRKKRIRAKR